MNVWRVHGRQHQQALARALRLLVEVLVETAVLNEVMRRSDLSRPKQVLWYSGVSTFPRAGSLAYLACRPATREWVARHRTTHPRVPAPTV